MAGTEYVAFLRAINVGGRGLVKMDALRNAFETAGCRNPRTFIASGNVVFELPPGKLETVRTRLRGTVGRLIGGEPQIVFRTVDDLRRLIDASPFSSRHAADGAKLYVAFLSALPPRKPRFPLVSEKEALEAFGMLDRDVLVVSRRKPNGFFGFPNNFIEDQLGVAATTRNWSTVQRIVEFVRTPHSR